MLTLKELSFFVLICFVPVLRPANYEILVKSNFKYIVGMTSKSCYSRSVTVNKYK